MDSRERSCECALIGIQKFHFQNIIPSGTYIWPFSFALPIDCPSSFEGKYGFIRYGIQVLVDKPKGKSFTVDSPISVAFLVNLNLIPKEMTNWKFNKDKVVLTVNPPAGAVSGETILITGLIENNHKETKITGMKASFHQIVTFRRNSKYTDKPLSVYETKKKELQMQRQKFIVVGGYSREFSLSFEVPPVVATIRNSKYLSVEYVLRFSTKDEIYGWSMDKREICVLVGNVPRVAEGSSGGPPYILMEGDISLNKSDRFPFVPVFPYYRGLGK